MVKYYVFKILCFEREKIAMNCSQNGNRLYLGKPFLIDDFSLEFVLHLSHNLLDLLCSELAL